MDTPAGTSTDESGPTAVILPSWMRTVPPLIGSPSTGTTYPPRIATFMVSNANGTGPGRRQAPAYTDRSPQDPVQRSPGASVSRSVPELSASGGLVTGSIATARPRPG